MPHRLTIRLDDDAWQTLTRVCEITGVSATAYLQGVVQVADSEWSAQDWRHPLEWEPSPRRDLALRAVEEARHIDSERRKRG